MQLELAER